MVLGGRFWGYDLAAAETSSYRDTANLGLGVRPRGAAHWVPGPTGDSG